MTTNPYDRPEVLAAADAYERELDRCYRAERSINDALGAACAKPFKRLCFHEDLALFSPDSDDPSLRSAGVIVHGLPVDGTLRTFTSPPSPPVLRG